MMEQSKITAKVVHDTRRMKQDGTYPLKLRITYQREFKDYRIGTDLTKDEYTQMMTPRNRNEKLREIRLMVQARENEAHEAIKSLPIFSFSAFEKRILGGKANGTVKTIYELMDDYVLKLKNDDRVSTSSSYQTALNSLKDFSRKLRYDDITADFLEKFSKHMIQHGRSATTIGIYLRSFRTIVNQAIELGYIQRSDYPFGKNRYQIPSGQNIKKALKLEQIKKLLDHPTVPGTNEDRAKDIWMFSYLCNGMNIKDICRLRYRDIHNNTIVFVRAKTERTSRSNLTSILVKPVQEAFGIIAKWGNQELSKNTLFKISHEMLTSICRELVNSLNLGES
jgi:integrase/recombinase XerD